MADKKPLKILILSYDWRNIFENDFESLKSKLERDRLDPNFNNFFIFNWSSKNYYGKRERIETVHLKTWLTRNRVVWDIAAIFALPFILWRRKFKPDIIFLLEFPLVFSAIPLKAIGSKIILLLGALPSGLARAHKEKLRYFYQRFAEILTRNFVDTYFFISEATKNYLLNLGVNEKLMKKLDLNVIKSEEELIKKADPIYIKRKLNIPENFKIILSVGRLEPEKGFPRLIKAFKDADIKDAVLIIAGEGVLRQELENLVKKLDLSKKVIFAGHVKRNEIWSFYKAADAFILLSYSEGLGVVLWEAMYAGAPVIGSRIGGILDTIGEGEERGFLWEEGDGIEKLKSIFEKVFERKEIEDKIKKARNYVKNIIEKNYNINDLLKKHDQ